MARKPQQIPHPNRNDLDRIFIGIPYAYRDVDGWLLPPPRRVGWPWIPREDDGTPILREPLTDEQLLEAERERKRAKSFAGKVKKMARAFYASAKAALTKRRRTEVVR